MKWARKGDLEPPDNPHRSLDRSLVSARICLLNVFIHVSLRHRTAEYGGPVEIVVTWLYPPVCGDLVQTICVTSVKER